MPKNRVPNFVILLAAGKGTRLLPYTKTTPKPLLKYNNQAIIDYAFNAIKYANIVNVLLITNYLEKKIHSHINNLYKDLNIFFHHQENIIGTANALKDLDKQIIKKINNYVLISATDYVLDKAHFFDLMNFHSNGDQDISISLKVVSQNNLKNSSIVVFNKKNTIEKIIEKPSMQTLLQNKNKKILSASLIYVLPKSFLYYLNQVGISSRDEYELPEVINLMIKDGYIAKGLLQSNMKNWEKFFL